jgi:hypothetical protein
MLIGSIAQMDPVQKAGKNELADTKMPAPGAMFAD